MAPEISVVIPTHNRRELLRSCLDSLSHQTAPADAFEVVVAVDGSTDGTEAMLDELSTPYALRMLVQPQAGPGAARNHGVKVARGRLVLLLDDDMVAATDLLAAHLAAHRAGSGRAVIGHIDRAPADRPDRFAQHRARDWQEHYHGLERRQATPRDAYSGNLSVERDRYLSAGGFMTGDDEFDDVEFAVRLASEGVELDYAPAAVAVETSSEDWRDVVHDQERRGRASLVLIERNGAILPWLPLGGRGTMSRRHRTLQSLLLRLHVSPVAVARLALLMPGDRRSHAALSFAFHYAYWSGVRRAADRGAWQQLARGVTILMYHAVGAEGEPPSRYVVPARRLERQLWWLARRGYAVISLDEYLRLRSEFRLPPAKSVVLTFDDGYRDNLELARPLLERHGLPATIFLITAGGGVRRSSDDALAGRSILTLAEARAALGGVVAFGAHTRSHPRLTELSDSEVATEIAGSRHDLEEALSRPVPVFAYPYGKFDERVRQAVVDAGFAAAVSVEPGRNRPATDPFALRRIEVYGTYSLLRFALTMWLGDLRRAR